MHACRFGRFRFDPDTRRLTDEAGAVLPLTGRPFDVLEHLIRHRDRVIAKDELLAAVWPNVVVEDNNLTQAVSTIRRVLGDSRDTPQFVATIAGRGYRFVAPLAADEAGAAAPTPKEPAQPSPPPPWHTRPRVRASVAGSVVILIAVALGLSALRREAAPVTQPAAPETTKQIDLPTIAVLPFRASTAGEDAELLAASVTDLLRDRLAAFNSVVVIANAPQAPTDNAADVRELGQKLHAQFLLQGTVASAGDRLRVDARLVEVASDAELWSSAFEHPLTQLATIRTEIANRVAASLHLVSEDDATAAAADAPIKLDAYELYVQGRQLMSNLRVDDTDKAIALFRRATILDSAFARGYLALGQAQLLRDRIGGAKVTGLLESGEPTRANAGTDATLAEARQALDRSLELNPALGEAWIERAALESDRAKAEELYRKGLRLAPNYGVGYLRFSEFLFDRYRKGEAIEMIDRARRLDPLTPSLHLRKAFLLMVSRSDVAGHDQLLREALEINPSFHPAITQLALSNYEYSGEFAAAVRLIERSMALDTQSNYAKRLAARMYLDVDDPTAALAVLRDSQQPSDAMVEIAQYQRESARAAALARSRGTQRWVQGPVAPLAEAIRDDAIATGDYSPALSLLQSQYAMANPDGGEPRMWSRGLALVYAHTLVLAGEAQRGRLLVTSLMVQIDSESVGRTPDWFSRERATALAILHEDGRALEQLEASVKTKKIYRWWYLAERDPAFAHLRQHPRFRALAEQVKDYRHSQRALLDESRRKGDVPRRTS